MIIIQRFLLSTLVILLSFQFIFAQQKNIEIVNNQGDVNVVENAVLNGYRLFSPEKLPIEFQIQSDVPIKCGTTILREIQTNFSKMNESDQRFFSPHLARPNLPFFYISPEGIFKLHFALTGFDAVSDSDITATGVPDYIEESARSFEFSYHILIDTLGYNPPPADFEVDGPEIDVYFRDIGFYGLTFFETEITSTPNTDYTSYMILDNNYEESFFYSKGLSGMQVTAAHELFHVVQLGYHFRDMDRGFLEMSATWMEDRVFDDVNDYYQYLSSFQLSTNFPVGYSNGNHEYGSSIFLKYIEEAHSEDIIRRTWELIPNSHSMKSMNSALQENGSNLASAFAEFAIWNYFTDDRAADLKFFKEAENYPKILVNPVITFQEDTTIVDSSVYLTLKYYRIQPETSGFYIALQQHDQPEIWQTGVITESGSGYEHNIFSGSQVGQIGLIQGLSEFILVAANGSIPEDLSERLSRLDKSVFYYQIEKLILGESKRIFPNPFNSDKHSNLSVRINLPNTSLLDAYILTEGGLKIDKIQLGRYEKGDTLIQFPWDGYDNQSRRLANGVYICVISGENFSIPVKFVLVR